MRRTAALVVAICALLFFNLAVLASDGLHDAARRALVSMLPDGSLPVRRSRAELSAEIDGLKAERRDMVARATRLEADRARLRGDLDGMTRRATGLEVEAAALRTRVARDVDLRREAAVLTDAMAGRTRRGVIRNFGGMATEAIPYVGVMAIVGLTFLEVHDACASMRDMRALSALMQGTSPEDLPICGYAPAEFLAALRGGRAQMDCGEIAGLAADGAPVDCRATALPWEEDVEAEGPGFERSRLPWEDAEAGR